MKGHIVWCFLLWCYALFDINLVKAFSDPQILVDGSETILQVHENHTIFCQGTRPLRWKTPDVQESYASWTNFRTEESNSTDLPFLYESRLYIDNMSFPFVGFYYCLHDNVEDLEGASKVYIYVDDPENLLVPSDKNTTSQIDSVYAMQYETVIIPCRPTSPNVHVELLRDAYDLVRMDVFLENDVLYHYDNFFGFISNHTVTPSSKLYACKFSRDLIEKQKLVQVFTESSGWICVIKNTGSQKSPCDILPAASTTKYEGWDFKNILEVMKFNTWTDFFMFNTTIAEKSIEQFFPENITFIEKPVIKDNHNGHTTVGRQLNLTCDVFTKLDLHLEYQWLGPDVSSYITNDQTLIIDETSLADAGVYTCIVSDHHNHISNSSIEVKIYDKGEHNLTMYEPNDRYRIQTYAGKESVTWTVFCWGHPTSKFIWTNNRNLTIPKKAGEKYVLYSNGNSITLTINTINVSDFGTYTLTGTNKYENKTLEFFLNVTDAPIVTMATEPFHMVGKSGKVNCTATAYPAPVFQWFHKPCMRKDCDYHKIEGTLIEESDMMFVSQVEITIEEPVSSLKCMATNFNGTDESTIEYIVSDFENGFGMTGFDESVVFDESEKNAIFAVGSPIRVKCGASSHKYKNLVWLLNGTSLKADDKYKIMQSKNNYSDMSYLEIDNTNYGDTGKYSCMAELLQSRGRAVIEYRNMTFLIQNSTKPTITGSEKEETIEKNYPLEAELFCEVHGIPKPKITWYKSGVEFHPDGSRIVLRNDNKLLRFNETNEHDGETYECRAQNQQGNVSKIWHLKIKNKGGSMLLYAMIIVVLIIVCTVMFGCLFCKLRKERRLQRELKLLGLANFEKGAVENINPDLGLDDQVELLPYDKKWEFPIENLKLGKQLGSGAFGVVMKGEAKHITEGEPITTVAVKMVKKNADHVYIKALASELKVMVHLGQHLNVVNLLGACTKNVIKKELLVIVEFCRYGNVQNYLLRHRDNFVDQVDPKNGKLNYSMGQDILDRTYSVSSNRSVQSPLLKYAALAFSNKSSGPVVPSSSSMGDYRANQNSGESATTDMSSMNQNNDVVLSNNSIQPEWRSNYRGDYRGNVKPISTKDLVAWSFQIARGMDYLSSRKVLHGDLAARNILLADDNIVKICDFGLAKTMYKNDNYKKRSDCPLPVKWMAIESIRDRIFSTQSDVWSFGIVLWELFSLARTPYPGMEADEKLYHKLLEGYRMESPQYAPIEIYEVMNDCWKSQPLQRPSFPKLTERLGSLLEDTLRKYYIDLNDPYLVMNTKEIEGKDDYLAMVSPPTFEALSSPLGKQDLSDDGYMSMNPGSIFSPRVTESDIFDFNIPNRKHLSSEGGAGQELLPMLRVVNESDTETPLASPNMTGEPNGVSNPSYHLPPLITQEKARNEEIVKSADNYVNMPKSKSALRGDKSDHHYVNGDIVDCGSFRA